MFGDSGDWCSLDLYKFIIVPSLRLVGEDDSMARRMWNRLQGQWRPFLPNELRVRSQRRLSIHFPRPPTLAERSAGLVSSCQFVLRVCGQRRLSIPFPRPSTLAERSAGAWFIVPICSESLRPAQTLIPISPGHQRWQSVVLGLSHRANLLRVCGQRRLPRPSTLAERSAGLGLVCLQEAGAQKPRWFSAGNVNADTDMSFFPANFQFVWGVSKIRKVSKSIKIFSWTCVDLQIHFILGFAYFVFSLFATFGGVSFARAWGRKPCLCLATVWGVDLACKVSAP